jgi:succinoglycan biosynthesis protein ExoA
VGQDHGATRSPLVTVLVPVRDEERWIGPCLEHLAAQDLDPARLEVVVVDGGSTDATVAVLRGHPAGRRFGRFVVVTGEGDGTTPSNLNIGLGRAEGDYVCRVDARSLVPPSYVRVCTEVLGADPTIAVVGGRQVAVAAEEGPVETGIARALNNRFGTGLARYRRTSASGPADTVYLGAFRRSDLEAVGGWDPAFPTNQDFELNRRLRHRGTIYVRGDLEVGYVPRATLGALFAQYRRFGRWKARYWRSTGDRPRPRQVALLAVPPAGVAAGLAARRRPLVVVAGAAAALAFESAGTSGPPGGVRARLASLCATAVIAGAWELGVVEGAVGRRT